MDRTAAVASVCGRPQQVHTIGMYSTPFRIWAKTRQSIIKQWILRLVMDRRPRNAEERKLVPSEDTVPHVSCFTDIVLEPGYILRVWSTDLPQYYYRMKVSDERAQSNVFTEPLDAREFVVRDRTQF